jgi:hypothetical protein
VVGVEGMGARRCANESAVLALVGVVVCCCCVMAEAWASSGSERIAIVALLGLASSIVVVVVVLSRSLFVKTRVDGFWVAGRGAWSSRASPLFCACVVQTVTQVMQRPLGATTFNAQSDTLANLGIVFERSLFADVHCRQMRWKE